MILFSHPTGNENVRAAAYGLASAGLLAGFRTSVATFPGSFSHKLAKFNVFGELNRRGYDVLIEKYTKTWGGKELGRLLASKAGLHYLTAHEKGFFSVDAVYKDLDKRVARELARNPAAFNGVYAYEDGAASSFTQAKKSGIRCFYDLPIGYWRTARKLLQPEKERWPGFAVTITGFRDSEEKLARKDEELRLADVIFVASNFTAASLRDYPGQLAEVKVVPYGFPPIARGNIAKSFTGNRKLKVLFVGGLSQRKGIADLFKAADVLKNSIELTLVGARPVENCPALDAALAKHTWVAGMPNKDVLALMRANDILIFPSLFEGFGLVITEAMSQGTPVITTGRTAGPDLITSGKDGWLIEAGSAEAICTKFDAILSNPGVVAAAGKEALQTASARPWKKYGEDISAAVLERLAE